LNNTRRVWIVPAFISAFDRDRLLADTVCYRFIVIGEGINTLLGNPQSGLAPAAIIAVTLISTGRICSLRNISYAPILSGCLQIKSGLPSKANCLS